MNKTFSPILLASALMLAATSAHAQASFRIGPKVGINQSFGRLEYPDNDYLKITNSSRSGAEAGLVAQIGLGTHWSVQPAVLYSQKGFSFEEDFYDASYDYTYHGEYEFRFNYLAVPLNVMYSSQEGGQGLQVFAGPYAGFLLGGKYKFAQSGRNGNDFVSGSDGGSVEAGDTYKTGTDAPYVSKGVDVGLQGGLGYGFGNGLQMQLGYSQGLRQLGAKYGAGRTNEKPPTYRSHAFQFSVAYLFGSQK
jgi:Outer membrane protein beta-barrel domain